MRSASVRDSAQQAPPACGEPCAPVLCAPPLALFPPAAAERPPPVSSTQLHVRTSPTRGESAQAAANAGCARRRPTPAARSGHSFDGGYARGGWRCRPGSAGGVPGVGGGGIGLHGESTPDWRVTGGAEAAAAAVVGALGGEGGLPRRSPSRSGLWRRRRRRRRRRGGGGPWGRRAGHWHAGLGRSGGGGLAAGAWGGGKIGVGAVRAAVGPGGPSRPPSALEGISAA